MLKSFKLFLFTFLIFGLSISGFAQNQTARGFLEEGVRLAKAKQYEQALEAFRQSAKLEPKDAATHANIGQALIRSIARQNPSKRIVKPCALRRKMRKLTPDSVRL